LRPSFANFAVKRVLFSWNQKTLTAKCAKKDRKARKEIQTDPLPRCSITHSRQNRFVLELGFSGTWRLYYLPERIVVPT